MHPPCFFRALVLLLAIALCAPGCKKSTRDTGVRDAERRAVAALGRVTPGRAAISIAAQTGSRILKLEVTRRETSARG